jgi:hypothetical protein
MATYLGFPFDPELFNYNWANAKDPTLTAMFESGAVAPNAELARLIANGSDFYTLPFYKIIGGTPENYDGATDITLTDPAGGAQNGIVFGRAHGWKEKDFIVDYNSGADPMQQIVSQVSKYWQKQRQSIMLKILNAVFGVTGSGEFADWANHTTDLSSASTTVGDANKMGATTIGDAIQKAVGDNQDAFQLVFMHSKVATNMAGLKLLDFLKYTDANGVERPLRIGTVNGMTVVVDDGCPTTAADTSKAATYTTYVLGLGAIQYAPAPVKVPSELTRDALKGGGYDALVTRIRETMHPNGFSFTKPTSGYTASPTDAQLAATANWSIVADPKTIALAKIITNG